ncbi:MAG: hypothetical protein WAU01_02220 [Saprospiraceae bacterium]
MEIVLEVIKYSIPALVVFGITYTLLKYFFGQQYQLALLKQQDSVRKDIFALKLQAYERIMMLCERINIENLAYRLMHPDMGVGELRNAMLVAIQQEFEHNISQQIYVSENLWKIIQLAKDQLQMLISETEGDSNADYLSKIRKKMMDDKMDPIRYAKTAIQSEVALIL